MYIKFINWWMHKYTFNTHRTKHLPSRFHHVLLSVAHRNMKTADLANAWIGISKQLLPV